MGYSVWERRQGEEAHLRMTLPSLRVVNSSTPAQAPTPRVKKPRSERLRTRAPDSALQVDAPLMLLRIVVLLTLV